MSELDSTTSIGGISVELRGDTGPLKSDVAAGIAAAKAAAKANPVVMKMTLDTSALQAHATAVKQATQAFAQMIGSASGSAGTMRQLTPRIDAGPMEGQLARLKATFAQTMIAMRTAASTPIPVMVSRAGGNGNWTWGANASGGGGVGGGNSGGGGINTVNIPNGGGDDGSGGGKSGGSAASFLGRGLGRLASGAFIAREIFQESRDRQSYAAEKILADGDQKKELTAMLAYRDKESQRGFGIVGGLAVGISNMREGRGFMETGDVERARIERDTARIDKHTEELAEKNRMAMEFNTARHGFRFANATYNADPITQARAAADERHRVFEEKAKDPKVAGSKFVRDARHELNQLEDKEGYILDRQEALLNEKVKVAGIVSGMEYQAIQARSKHDNESARIIERSAERRKMIEEQGDAREKEKDSYRSHLLLVQQYGQRESFDAESQRLVANDAQGFRSRMRSTSQHMVASQQRTGRNFFAAKLTDFDAETGSILDDPNLQARDKPWKTAQRYMQRGEMIADHNFNIGQAKSSLDARAQAAGIRSGTGSPQAILDEQAGVLMTTQHMMNEIAAADPALRAKMKSTFVSELQEHRASLDKSSAGGTAQTMRSYLETNSLMSRDYSDPVRGELDNSINKVGKANTDIGGGKTIGDLYIRLGEFISAIGSASGLGPIIGN